MFLSRPTGRQQGVNLLLCWHCMIKRDSVFRDIHRPFEFLPKRFSTVLLLPSFASFRQILKQDDAKFARVVAFYVRTGETNVARFEYFTRARNCIVVRNV